MPAVMELGDGGMYSPQSRLVVISFGGETFEGNTEFLIYVTMSTDGSKTFYLDDTQYRGDIIHDYPIEISDSGITRDYGDGKLDGWVDLTVFDETFHIVITSIKYVPGHFFD